MDRKNLKSKYPFVASCLRMMMTKKGGEKHVEEFLDDWRVRYKTRAALWRDLKLGDIIEDENTRVLKK